MTEHAPMPDEFRTMAACEALGTMLPVFERYGSLVTLVMKELLRSIYEVLPMQGLRQATAKLCRNYPSHKMRFEWGRSSCWARDSNDGCHRNRLALSPDRFTDRFRLASTALPSTKSTQLCSIWGEVFTVDDSSSPLHFVSVVFCVRCRVISLFNVWVKNQRDIVQSG